MSREQEIFDSVMKGETFQQIGDRLSLSRQRVNQIFHKYEKGVEIPQEDLRAFWRAMGGLRRAFNISYSRLMRGSIETARHIFSGEGIYMGQYDIKGKRIRDRLLRRLMGEVKKSLDELEEPIKELERIAHSKE